MTKDEAIADLLTQLSLTAAVVGEARAAECRQIRTDALGDEPLPTSWFEAWERVAALDVGQSVRPYKLNLVFGPLNRVLHTGVPFSRDFW